jgi:hypothetical protein
MPHSSGSLLLGLVGVVVESVHVDEDRIRTVHVRTAADWVGRCPGCSARSTRSKGWVATRPRDIRIGPDRLVLVWSKRKWLCTNTSCERTSFTESTPAIPPRARVRVRAKTEMSHAVLDDDRSVKAVALAYGCSWGRLSNRTNLVVFVIFVWPQLTSDLCATALRGRRGCRASAGTRCEPHSPRGVRAGCRDRRVRLPDRVRCPARGCAARRIRWRWL